MFVTDPTSEANQYYIVSASPTLGERFLVLKQGEMFGVFDSSGNINSELNYEEGLYFKGTRFLSKLSLSLLLFESSAQPHLLSSSVRADNVLLGADLTNPDVYTSGGHGQEGRPGMQGEIGPALRDGDEDRARRRQDHRLDVQRVDGDLPEQEEGDEDRDLAGGT
jgi:hypothetical protein